MISHLHYPRDQSRYAPSPWETFLHCDDVSHWLVAYLDWSLSVMLINTAFSHSNEEYSPYFLVITHQTQARDDIDGLMQKRRNPITNALEYFFLALCHPYKECHLWVSTVHICTATNREYRIGTVDFVIHSHLLPSLPILIWCEIWCHAICVTSLQPKNAPLSKFKHYFPLFVFGPLNLMPR